MCSLSDVAFTHPWPRAEVTTESVLRDMAGREVDEFFAKGERTFGA